MTNTLPSLTPTARTNWHPIRQHTPPDGHEVVTKIDDEKGARNEQTLVRKGNLWFFPDMSMYVYYTPTHFRLKDSA